METAIKQTSPVFNRITGIRKIFVLILYGILNYWHLVGTYTVMPESSMNPDKSLNLFGCIYFALWAAAPLIGWGLFLWVLLAGLKLDSLNRPSDHSSTAISKNPFADKQLMKSVFWSAVSVCVMFGTARLALDIFEIIFYGGHFHMDTTYYGALMRFIQTIAVYVSISFFIVYKNHDVIKTHKVVRSILIALILIYVPGFVIFFVGQSIILDAAWWFPIPDGHGWSESQIDMANKFTLLSKWLPLLFAGFLVRYTLIRVKATVK